MSSAKQPKSTATVRQLDDAREFSFEPVDNTRLSNLYGALDNNLRQIEQRLGVEIHSSGGQFRVLGPEVSTRAAESVLRDLYDAAGREPLSPEAVHLSLQQIASDEISGDSHAPGDVSVQTRRGLVRGRTANQRRYLRNIRDNDINFGIGPAGSGKTYLAVASAVSALEKQSVRRVILVRPAVEAGERLGFLPGDLAQKIDPYLRPLYDALYEMLGFDRVAHLIDHNVIEVAPLAYMRGRTLNEAFVILDEAQNTTVEQMKMFLTRIGFSSRAVVTGDITQIDLPRHELSGLKHASNVLRDVPGIAFTQFRSEDVVRHPLVQRIVEAYAADEDDG